MGKVIERAVAEINDKRVYVVERDIRDTGKKVDLLINNAKS
jgi:short-subunit dehydrogenase